MEDEEEMEPVENDGGEQASKVAYVAAKIKDFANATAAAATDDNDADKSKRE
jgi:hypothetical protein